MLVTLLREPHLLRRLSDISCQLRQAGAAEILGFNCLHPAGVSVACWKKPTPRWRLVEAWADGEERTEGREIEGVKIQLCLAPAAAAAAAEEDKEGRKRREKTL